MTYEEKQLINKHGKIFCHLNKNVSYTQQIGRHIFRFKILSMTFDKSWHISKYNDI